MSFMSRLTVKPIQVRRVINAPADDLWALFANPHRHADLDGHGMSDIMPGTVYGPQRLQAGDVFTVQMKKGKMTYTMTLLCVQSRPGREVAWKSIAPAVWRWRFVPTGVQDKTTVIGEWIPTNRLYAPVYAALGVMTHNKRGLLGTLDRLEAIVAESPATP